MANYNRTISDETRAEVRVMKANGASYGQIARKLNINKSTAYRIYKEAHIKHGSVQTEGENGQY